MDHKTELQSEPEFIATGEIIRTKRQNPDRARELRISPL